MRKIEPEFITGMGYIGASPGVLYHMGGAGETVVTGNPALLEGVKGSRFTSFTLHGISTQGSTTGAQLLPFEVGEKREGLEVFKDGIAISGARKNDIYAVGRSGMGNESSYDDFPLLASGEYYVYSDSASVNLFVVAFRNGINITLGSSMKGVAAKIKVMDGDKFRIFLRLEEAFNGKVKAMISKTQPTASNYEPYTGGKPSPSPEYPQEIESVGQGKTIGVEVRGKNLLNPLRFFSGRTHNGITWTVKNNGEIVCEGTALGDSFMGTAILYPDVRWLKIPAGRYVLSGSGEHVMVYINTVSLNGDTGNAYYCQYNSSIKCVFTEDVYISLQAMVRSGETAAETVCPQLESGDTATSYEPYHEPQFASIATPNGLPGIPVSSGGNYTDEKGQQWVCDEVDFKKDVYVQRIGKRTITSKDVFHKSGMSTDDVNYFSLGNFSLHIGTIGEKDVLMSNCFVAGINHGFSAWGKIFLSSAFDGKVYFSVEAQKYPDEETFKQWAVENGLMFLYQLVDIIETPLAAEELSAYKTLRTYSPTTTVINDAEAGMSVGYKRRK